MFSTMLKGKIHRATVVQAELDYVGSITVDEDLMDAAGIREHEQVQVVDVNGGRAFRDLRHRRSARQCMICLSGAAARCVSVGDKVIIMCYALDDPEEAPTQTRRAWCSSTTTTAPSASPATSATADWRTWTASAPSGNRRLRASSPGA